MLLQLNKNKIENKLLIKVQTVNKDIFVFYIYK